MKNYTITVNGNVYEVTVEEGNGAAAPIIAPVTKATAPTPVAASSQSPAAPVAQVSKPAAGSGAQGNIKVNAPMPGKIVALKVNPGQTVKRGEVVLILEAMKMENEIVAPSDGIVAGVNVTVGASVDAGEVLVTLN